MRRTDRYALGICVLSIAYHKYERIPDEIHFFETVFCNGGRGLGRQKAPARETGSFLDYEGERYRWLYASSVTASSHSLEQFSPGTSSAR